MKPERYLVRRSRTCCLRLGMVARASTMVQAACRAACVAGVKSTCGTQERSPGSGDGRSRQAPSRAVLSHPSRRPLGTSPGKG